LTTTSATTTAKTAVTAATAARKTPTCFGVLAGGPFGSDPLTGAHLGLRASPRPR
jgi:hypothetical protein